MAWNGECKQKQANKQEIKDGWIDGWRSDGKWIKLLQWLVGITKNEIVVHVFEKRQGHADWLNQREEMIYASALVHLEQLSWEK